MGLELGLGLGSVALSIYHFLIEIMGFGFCSFYSHKAEIIGPKNSPILTITVKELSSRKLEIAWELFLSLYIFFKEAEVFSATKKNKKEAEV